MREGWGRREGIRGQIWSSHEVRWAIFFYEEYQTVFIREGLSR